MGIELVKMQILIQESGASLSACISHNLLGDAATNGAGVGPGSYGEMQGPLEQANATEASGLTQEDPSTMRC